MDTTVAEKLLDEVFPCLEALEAQNAAILQVLKDKGMATDDQLAPYLEQARMASNVRWRAARLRMNHVLTISAEPPSEERKPEADQKAKSQEKSGQSDRERSEQHGKTVGSENKEKTEAAHSNREDGKKEAAQPKHEQKDAA